MDNQPKSLAIGYRVLSTNSINHTITVRYFSNILTEEMLASDFNSDGTIKLNEHGKPNKCKTDYELTYYATNEDILNKKISQNTIIEFIEASAPKNYFQTQELIINGNIDYSVIDTLLGFEKTFEHMTDFILNYSIKTDSELIEEWISDNVEKYLQEYEEKTEEEIHELEQRLHDYIEDYVDKRIK